MLFFVVIIIYFSYLRKIIKIQIGATEGLVQLGLLTILLCRRRNTGSTTSIPKMLVVMQQYDYYGVMIYFCKFEKCKSTLMALSLPILDTLIQNQEDAIRRHTLHSCVIVIIGIAIIVFTNFLLENNNEMMKNLLNLGGGLVSTLSAYPINQIISRKEKANTYKMFKQNIGNMSPEESKKFEDMIWGTLNKI